MGFSRQEYWSGLPCPLPRDIPKPGIEPESLRSPSLAGCFFPTSTIWEAQLLWAVLCFVDQSCLTLCGPVDYSLPGFSVHGDSPGKNTGVRC